VSLPPSESPQRSAVRRRVRKTKVAIGAAGVLAFGIALALARVSYAGHSKQPEAPLLSPQPLYDVVAQNLLVQAGAAMPATEPPEATTHSS
jgi:hypothetical protein